MQNINSWESKFQPCLYSSKLLDAIAAINITVKTPTDIHQIKKACHIAREYHGSQLRKSGEPYYSHPLEVGHLFSEYTGTTDSRYYTTDLVIAAILHDCLEDTALTKDMIAKIFNKSIADKVEDLTRVKGTLKLTAADTLHSLFSQNKIGVLYIKIFDRLHNMRTLDAMKPEKRK
jgi:(p)ppGpp synthase/HD superfamily hydrolase